VPSGLRTITTAEGRQVVAQLDAKGRVVWAERTGLAPTTFVYDSQGRVETVTAGVGADARTTTLAYRPDGTVGSVTNGVLRTTEYVHDSAGRLISATLPDLSTI